MSFDGIVTKSVVEELNKYLISGKINKINQPDKNCIILNIYNNKENYKLLLDASSNNPRINLTKTTKENPLTAPNFCMLLRKHIQGGQIVSIKQLGLDRVVTIDIKSMNELGDYIIKSIVIEIMGKYSNIIFIQNEDKKIIDSIKKITFDISRVRQILPGLTYENIADNKIDITNKVVSPSNIISSLEKPIKLSKLFYLNYTGFSPQLGEEIIYRGNLNFEMRTSDLSNSDIINLDNSFFSVTDEILKSQYEFKLYKTNDNNHLNFHCINQEYLGKNFIEFSSISELLDYYYNSFTISDKVSQKKSNIQKKVKTNLNKSINKLDKLNNEKINSEDRDKYRIWADLISANTFKIEKGQKNITVENFFDPNMSKINIELDESKNPWENAQFYYKKFSKLKTSNKLLEKQIPNLEEEIKYLNQVLETLNHVETSFEIEEIKIELEKNNYLNKTKIHKNKNNNKPSTPLHFLSNNGADIYVGKNNYQNDYLTMKFANKDDYFIHAKNIPGSHVILRNNNIIEDDILDACKLAAFFSSNSKESFVQVDYTFKKNVRKVKNSKPGMVYYDNYETIMIDLNNFNLDIFKKIE